MDASQTPRDVVHVTAPSVRLSAIRAEISSRICRVTEGMQREDFDALVNQMAIVQDKYEQRTPLNGW